VLVISAGLIRVLDIPLTDSERRALHASAKNTESHIASLKLESSSVQADEESE
jgi:malate/lactate dehydrogenase